MPIPTSRRELVELIETEFARLLAELEHVEAELADAVCVDDWTIKDLLAVRLWWTRSVVNWVEQGRRGRRPVTPAKGYRWNETPRLNADIISRSRNRSYSAISNDLRRQYSRLLRTIDSLSDRELLTVGVFEWAGRYPVARWLSINTARQYHTARSYVRRAVKAKR